MLTKHTLRRFLKTLGYSWKRFRKSLKSKQNEEEYNRKLADLERLLELHKSKYIDLFFADESSFNLEGYVPYGWQFEDEQVCIEVTKGRAINCFGLLSRDNHLIAKTTEKNINSEFVLEQLETFSFNLQKPTVVVLDNASAHTAKKIKDRITCWQKRGLYIFYLPPYSPQLNIIERFWKELKEVLDGKALMERVLIAWLLRLA